MEGELLRAGEVGMVFRRRFYRDIRDITENQFVSDRIRIQIDFLLFSGYNEEKA